MMQDMHGDMQSGGMSTTTATIMETTNMVDHTGMAVEPPLPQATLESGETDSRRSSTKRRVMDLTAARLRQQCSVEVPGMPLAAAATAAVSFNRISRQRMKRLSRDSILRNTTDDMMMVVQPPPPPPLVPLVQSPPLVSAQLDNMSISAGVPPPSAGMPQQRLSGSSLRQSILGGRKTSTDSGSRMQQSTPTNMPNMPSVSSFSHGGSGKATKKVAFAKSELDDFDDQLFKPHEFDDVFSDLKIET